MRSHGSQSSLFGCMMDHKMLVCCLGVILLFVGAEAERRGKNKEKAPFSLSEEVKLTKILTENYKRRGVGGRPVPHHGDSLEVKFGVSLQQVLDINIEKDTFTTLIWYNYEWKDNLLTWNTSEYEGVQSVRLNPDDIYIPDIMAYNEVPGLSHFEPTLVVVFSDGTCTWVPRGTLTTGCSFSESDPYEFSCSMKFGSWTYDGLKLNLTSKSDEVDVSTYTPRRDWTLVSSPIKRNILLYECCPEPYMDITATITMKKHSRKDSSLGFHSVQNKIDRVKPYSNMLFLLIASFVYEIK